MIKSFVFAKTPQLHFGTGKLSELSATVKTFGTNVLLVTGARSFIESREGQRLQEHFEDERINFSQYAITREPTPGMIDQAVNEFSSPMPDCVVAIGGGSALDAGKAISAMLPLQRNVKDFLEGVGTANHPGIKVPFIAIPTTSGTGSEATKNAVICETGTTGYKRSLRHSNFVPDVAIIDPLLTTGCPQSTTAASGMDAFTQLLESYLSTASNPVTDSLALEGLHRIERSLLRSYQDGNDIAARTDMSLAAYLSGITLANAGLGLIHGLASPLGGYFDIPHGVICSALMAPANRISVQKLRSENNNPGALRKYAIVGRLFSGNENGPDAYFTDLLLDTISSMAVEMRIPRLGEYGVTENHLQKIVSATDNKNNPVVIDKEEMTQVLRATL